VIVVAPLHCRGRIENIATWFFRRLYMPLFSHFAFPLDFLRTNAKLSSAFFFASAVSLAAKTAC